MKTGNEINKNNNWNKIIYSLNDKNNFESWDPEIISFCSPNKSKRGSFPCFFGGKMKMKNKKIKIIPTLNKKIILNPDIPELFLFALRQK